MQGQQIQAGAGLSQPQFSRFRFSGRFVRFRQLNRQCHKCASVLVVRKLIAPDLTGQITHRYTTLQDRRMKERSDGDFA